MEVVMFEPENVVGKYQEGLKDELIKDFIDLQWCMQYYYYKKEVFDDNPVFRNSTLFGIQRVVNRLNRIDGVWNQDVALKRKIYNLPRIIRDNSIDANWNKFWKFAIKDLPKIVKMCIGDDKYAECLEKAYYAIFEDPLGLKVARVEFFLNQDFSLKELKKARRIIYWCFRRVDVKCLLSSNNRLIFEDSVDRRYGHIWAAIISVQRDYPAVLKYINEAYYYHDGKNDLIKDFWFKKESDKR